MAVPSPPGVLALGCSPGAPDRLGFSSEAAWVLHARQCENHSGAISSLFFVISQLVGLVHQKEAAQAFTLVTFRQTILKILFSKKNPAGNYFCNSAFDSLSP